MACRDKHSGTGAPRPTHASTEASTPIWKVTFWSGPTRLREQTRQCHYRNSQSTLSRPASWL